MIVLNKYNKKSTFTEYQFCKRIAKLSQNSNLDFPKWSKKILLHKILEKLMLGFLMFISVFSQPDARKITIR